MNVIIAYDVEEDGKRARIAATLSACGIRLQKSVFECVVDHEGLAELVHRVEGFLDLDRDVFQVFHQCEGCHSARVNRGQSRSEIAALYWIV